MVSNACFCASITLGIGALGCGSSDSSPTALGTSGAGGGGPSGAGGGLAAAAAGSSGAGGRSSAGGGSNVAGTSGAGGAYDVASDPAFGVARPCPPPDPSLITDFTPTGVAADAGADAGVIVPGASFGNFPVTLSGGTFTYPNAPGDPYSVNSDVSTGEWHVSGDIGTYSGFGLYFQGCNRIDASNYLGISFSIRGDVAMGGRLTFSVGTSSNDISFVWLNSQPTPPNPLAEPNSGRCIPATSQYDGTCTSPTLSLPVTETETTVAVTWAELIGGAPSASVDPAEITSIGWSFPPPVGAGTPNATTYAVDLYIDDLAFISR